jgi:hypothetical protein
MRALLQIGRQKDIADTVVAGFGQFDSQVALGRVAQQLVGQTRENAGAVARVGLAAARASVFHVPQDAIRVVDNLPRADTFDVGNKSDAAAIVFESRIVESMLCRGAELPKGLRRMLVPGIC